MPRPASYLGVYESTSPYNYAQVADFGRVAGQQPNLAGYFSGWAEPFATEFAEQAYRHHAAVLVQIDPSYASVAAIAAGSYDGYLRSYADSVRDFGHPVIIGFGHEMNAPWYSWGYPHVQPATFVAAWRHIVRLFRGQGADNATWLWTINTALPRSGPVARWWPGPSYVTWVGVDGYFYRPSDTFASVFGSTIQQVRAFTRKPVLLAETAAGPVAGQPGKIAGLFAGLRRERALGLVWFDEDQDCGDLPPGLAHRRRHPRRGRLPAGGQRAAIGTAVTCGPVPAAASRAVTESAQSRGSANRRPARPTARWIPARSASSSPGATNTAP